MGQIADITAIITIIGLVVNFIGAVTLIGFNISSIRQAGLLLQSRLYEIEYGGNFDFKGLDDGLRRLSANEKVQPADDGFDNLARFIAVVSGGYWGRSGIFAGQQTYHAGPASALDKTKIWLSNDEEQVYLGLHDPTTPAVDIVPLEIERDRLYENADAYVEKRFLIAGAFLIAIGFAFQSIAEVIDLFNLIIGSIFGAVLLAILIFLFWKVRL